MTYNINYLHPIISLFNAYIDRLWFIEHRDYDKYWNKETKIRALDYTIKNAKEHFHKLKTWETDIELKHIFEKEKKEKLEFLINYSKKIKNNL